MARISAKDKLLDAALSIIREKGYSATSVDDLCQAAGVTKGAFFHHFASKEDLAVAAADHWSRVTSNLFAQADYHRPEDPLDRVLAYVDFRKQILQGRVPEFTCLVGTMVQEVYDSSPAIREACNQSIRGHAATLEDDIGAAIRKYGLQDVSAESLALHTQAVIQGAFVLAKAQNDASAATDSLDHLYRYLKLLFT